MGQRYFLQVRECAEAGAVMKERWCWGKRGSDGCHLSWFGGGELAQLLPQWLVDGRLHKLSECRGGMK